MGATTRPPDAAGLDAPRPIGDELRLARTVAIIGWTTMAGKG